MVGSHPSARTRNGVSASWLASRTTTNAWSAVPTRVAETARRSLPASCISPAQYRLASRTGSWEIVTISHDPGSPAKNPGPITTSNNATTENATSDTSTAPAASAAQSSCNATFFAARYTLACSRPRWLSAITMPRNAIGKAYKPRPVGPRARAIRTLATNPIA
jgi:hypothetical protein